MELEPKAYDLLHYLVEHRERVVTKDDLARDLWNQEVLSSSVVARLIALIRRELGEDGKAPSLIHTIRGRGYRFMGRVDSIGPEAERRARTQDRSDANEASVATMAYAFFDDLVVVVHDENPPSNEAWAIYTDEYDRRRERIGDLRLLAITDGGAPTAAQRDRLNQLLEEKSLHTAVISSAVIPRMMVSSLAMANWRIKGFYPHETPQALEFLGIPVAHLDAVLSVAQRLREQLA